MRLPILILTLAALSHAETLTVTAAAKSVQPGAPSMSFAGALSVPRFNPTLGTLRSVNWSLIVRGKLTWAVSQPATVDWSDLETFSRVSFLGQDVVDNRQQNVGPKSPCGVEGKPACPPVVTDLGKAYNLTGVTTDVQQFVGTGSVVLPAAALVKTVAINVAGALAGPQEISWELSVTYGYTPRQ